MSTQFYSYYGTIINIDAAKIDKIITKETLDKTLYNYIDDSGLSFMKIGTGYLYVSDPNYPICKSILDDQWQIFYDSTYTTGFGNIKFVGKNDSVFDNSKWKNINQVLASYNYIGALPLSSFESVYMKIIKFDSNTDPINYIPGTLLLPNQPFVYLKNTSSGSDYIFPQTTDNRIQYNTIVDSTDLTGADINAQITPIITGASDMGKIYLPLVGKYLIEASFGVSLVSNTLPSPQPLEIWVAINSSQRKRNYGTIHTISGSIYGGCQITATVKINDTDLVSTPGNAVTDKKARLEIFGRSWWATSALNLRQNEYTTLSVTYLG